MRLAFGWLAGVLVGLLAGTFIGVYVTQAHPEDVPVIAPGATAGSLDSRALDQALAVVRVHYYNRNLSYQHLSEGTVRGLISGLDDPFSEYLDPKEYQNQQNSYAGRYTGIGIYVDFRSDYPIVTSVIPGSPAEKAGLKAADAIVAVNGRDARGLKANAAAAEIQGPEGTSVNLTIDRAGQHLRFRIKRARIELPFVRSLLIRRVLYIRVYSFGTDTTAEFEAALQRGLPSAQGVVLDLRGNPGGFVSSATDLIDDFLTGGEAFEVRDRDGHVERTYVAGRHLAPAVPLAVLVDSNSASASEILAGSLQVHHRAELVGTQTFGKGTVQQDFPLYDGSDLHITIRHWFLPNGKSVDRVGLKPDVAVDLGSPDSMFQVDVPGSSQSADVQLQRALQVVET